MPVAAQAGTVRAAYKNQAPVFGAFSFAWILLLCPSAPALADDCGLPTPSEQQAVEYIYDGDTIRLQDGRKLRLVGVNTPETAKHDRPAGEPLAEKARQRLREIIGNDPVGLIPARDPKDRYGRLLAYVFDGQGRDIQVLLLREGLAAAIAVPPNLAHVPCYFREEQQARDDKRGIWAEPYFQPLQLPAMVEHGGFRLVTGKVTRVGNSRKSIWLNFSPGDARQARQGLSVRVARSDLDGFPDLDPASLKGHTIIARGWISFYKKEPVLRVRHQASLQVLD